MSPVREAFGIQTLFLTPHLGRMRCSEWYWPTIKQGSIQNSRATRAEGLHASSHRGPGRGSGRCTLSGVNGFPRGQSPREIWKLLDEIAGVSNPAFVLIMQAAIGGGFPLSATLAGWDRMFPAVRHFENDESAWTDGVLLLGTHLYIYNRHSDKATRRGPQAQPLPCVQGLWLYPIAGVVGPILPASTSWGRASRFPVRARPTGSAPHPHAGAGEGDRGA